MAATSEAYNVQVLMQWLFAAVSNDLLVDRLLLCIVHLSWVAEALRLPLAVPATAVT